MEFQLVVTLVQMYNWFMLKPPLHQEQQPGRTWWPVPYHRINLSQQLCLHLRVLYHTEQRPGQHSSGRLVTCTRKRQEQPNTHKLRAPHVHIHIQQQALQLTQIITSKLRTLQSLHTLLSVWPLFTVARVMFATAACDGSVTGLQILHLDCYLHALTLRQC